MIGDGATAEGDFHNAVTFAGVYRLTPDLAIVQTVDFFTPIVDDPFCYGQIAATNAISDIYAMGGRPLTALNIMGIPTDLVPNEVITEILRGGSAKAKEAGCATIGGHTIRNPEPIYGLAVTGMVSPRRMLTNSRARAGTNAAATATSRPRTSSARCTGSCGTFQYRQRTRKLRRLYVSGMAMVHTLRNASTTLSRMAETAGRIPPRMPTSSARAMPATAAPGAK